VPKKSDNPPVETEKGFGTGLRTKLEGRRGDSLSPPPPIPETRSPEAPQPSEPPLDEQPESEASEAEQLWAELEDALSREEALRRALSDHVAAQERRAAVEQELARRAEALEEREHALAEQAEKLEAQRNREGGKGRGKSSSQAPKSGESVRAYLQRRAENETELIWRVFEEALTATRSNGVPDYRTRLLAASTLLAEAYDSGSGMSPGEHVQSARDELANMRERRLGKQSP
jgi:hypothetical protein